MEPEEEFTSAPGPARAPEATPLPPHEPAVEHPVVHRDLDGNDITAEVIAARPPIEDTDNG